MNNKKFIIMLGLLTLIVLATIFIIRSYNPSKQIQLIEKQELREIETLKSLLGEAYSLMQENHLDAAEKRLHLLLRQAPQNIAALQMLGNIYFMQKKYTEAENTFRILIKIDPLHSVNYNNLSQSLVMQKKYQEAITELDKAIKLNPELAVLHLNLAELYIKLNDKKSALAALKKALELAKEQSSISINLKAFHALNDEKEFKEILQEYSEQEDAK